MNHLSFPFTFKPKSILFVLFYLIAFLNIGCYEYGATGPAGGIVIWCPNGMEGQQNCPHGIEAAPIDIEISGNFFHEWGCNGIDVDGADSTALTDGGVNTAQILLAGCTSDYGNAVAAYAALDFSYNGYDDWFLPSLDELGYIFSHRVALGVVTGTQYWSSSEFDATSAWAMEVGEGTSWLIAPKNADGFRVRPVRYF